MAARALLFDVDGTLWDSYPWYAELVAGLSGQDRDAVFDRLRAGKSVVTLAKRCGVTRGRLRSACANGADKLRLYPGVRETLMKLAESSRPCGVVTSLSGWIVEPLLDSLELRKHFPVVIHAGSGYRVKPDPSGLLGALAALGVEDRNEVFYVGDGTRDAQAAARAGIGFAWASYGYGDGCPADAAAVIAEFREVLDL